MINSKIFAVLEWKTWCLENTTVIEQHSFNQPSVMPLTAPAAERAHQPTKRALIHTQVLFTTAFFQSL